MTTTIKRPQVTAEWQCAQCASTNRKLVPAGTTAFPDRCMSCGSRHTVTPSPRPVRWDARAA